MELNHLSAFVAVASKASFSLAAEQLFLTQPAISKRIANLEAELNTRLFDRVGRRVLLTEAGQALLPAAQQIIATLQEARRRLSELDGSIRGRLSLGISHHLGLHRLPPVLQSYTQDYPEVELDIHFLDSEQACWAIERGELELAIVTLPDQTPANLQTQVIWPDPLAVMAAVNHPLAQQTGPIKLTALVAHGAILPSTATFTRRILQHSLQPHGLQLKINLESNYLETIKTMVAIGLGWGILPISMLDDSLRALNIEELHMHRYLGSVQHKTRQLSNAGRALLRMLERYSATRPE